MYCLKIGASQGWLLSLIFNYQMQLIYFHSLYMLSYEYVKFKESPCVGTDVYGFSVARIEVDRAYGT